MSTPKPKRSGHPPVPLRRVARELALQLLYQQELGQAVLAPEALAHFWTQAAEEREYLGEKEMRKIQPQTLALVQGVTTRTAELDERLLSCADNWRLDRMAIVDRNVMRLCIYELQFCPEVPPAVSINEAIDIAKLYGGDESGRFVNGILDRVRRSLAKQQAAAAAAPAVPPPPAAPAPEA